MIQKTHTQSHSNSTSHNRNHQKAMHKKNHRTRVIFYTCLVLLLTPIAVLAWILISASLETGNPVLGDRYKGDLDPAITKTQLTAVETAAKNVDGVDKVDVELKTATLRVYADIDDNADSAAASTAADSIYTAVTGILDPNTYFTQANGEKMYDLEVHVYNLDKDRDSDSFVYVIKMKTSSMDTASSQVVSEPVDAELAQQLRDNVEAAKNPTEAPAESSDITVNNGDTEPAAEATAESN